MSSTPSLKYSKRLAVIGAASAAVLSLGTASAAVTTVDTNVLLGLNYDTSFLAFIPNESRYITTYTESAEFPAMVRHCNLGLLNNDTANFQWTNSFLTEGSIVGASSSFQNTLSMLFPEDGQTVYAGYRYLSSYSGENPNYTYGYVSVTGGPLNIYNYGTFTVNSYTYESTENSGVSIPVIPEPSAALLAFAGAGLFLRRRRA